MYVVSENENSTLTQTNKTVKDNIKFWINQYKMINDTIDILDARIVNIGIDFHIKASQDFNKFEVLESARQEISEYFGDYHLEVGEPLYITNIYNVLKRTIGVDDVLKVKVKQQSGEDYSNAAFDIKYYMSADARILYVPEDVILEVKFLDTDVRGTVK